MRLSGRLYFFPAFLPFVELAPWVLAAMGAAAGAAGFSWARHRWIVLGLALACLAGAGGIVVYAMPDRETRIEGTRLIPVEEYPAVTRTGQAGEAVSTEFRSFGEIWTRQIGTQILSSPVVAGGVLVYGGYGGEVEAVSLKNGAPLWSLKQKTFVFAITEGADGEVYVGEGLHQTSNAGMTAIRAGTGDILWKRGFLGHIEENAALDERNHRLWTGTGPGGLWALDSRNGKVLWHQAIGHIDARPLLHEGVLYAPAQPDEARKETVLYALDAKRGKLLWTLKQPGQPWGSPQIDHTGKTILTSTGQGQIGIARETDQGWAQGVSLDGKLLWQVELPGMPLQPSQYIAESDLIIHATKTGTIVALRAVDGSEVWRAEAGGELQSSATLIPGWPEPMLATASYDGVFSIRNALTGEELARRTVGMKSTSSPAFAGDVVYVASAHEIRAFGGLHVLAGEK